MLCSQNGVETAIYPNNQWIMQNHTKLFVRYSKVFRLTFTVNNSLLYDRLSWILCIHGMMIDTSLCYLLRRAHCYCICLKCHPDEQFTEMASAKKKKKKGKLLSRQFSCKLKTVMCSRRQIRLITARYCSNGVGR